MLRYEDYSENRKGPQPGTVQSTNLFGPTATPPATNSAFSFGAPKPQGKCPRLTPSSTTLHSTRHYILYIESITGMLTFIAAITQLNHVLISH